MTMLGKFAIWALIVWLFRYPPRTALLVGLGLTQIGEFSYVLVRVARDAQSGHRRYLSRHSGGLGHHDPVEWPRDEGAAENSGPNQLVEMRPFACCGSVLISVPASRFAVLANFVV